ncbi:PAS domain S-box protein [Pedobacter sp. PLR]|uniref:PAS domain-containing sensor histidine kinase n=1 Tax=Pedobacter sp. PLR TaxID=2994465 RepID=UPI00224592C0|nr:PAS domain S-box protein [Pedobacter sp. PLR]MCX2451136.1 PAS domain S-box protein [Pedobacter sp. PLR]
MRRKTAFITLMYIALGALWLNLGSRGITHLNEQTPERDMRFLYDYKNLIFLVISGLILFLLIEMYRRSISAVENSYKQLFEGSIAMIYVFDRSNFRLLEVNERMVENYGYTRQELLTMSVMDLRPVEEQPKLENYLNTIHIEGRATEVWYHKRKNGEVFHVLISHHKTEYKGKMAYTVIAIDIEIYVKAEEKIKELLQVYETVTRVTNDVIWEYSPATDELKWQNGFSEIYGYTAALRENTKEWILSKVHPEDQAFVAKSMADSLEQLSNFWRCEYRLQCADATYKYVSNQAFILLDAQGQAEKMVGALRDITVRKDYEHRLLQKNEILKKIAWENSHKLRKPVSNIIGIVNLMKIETKAADPALMEMLERSALELDEMISRINESTSSIGEKD